MASDLAHAELQRSALEALAENLHAADRPDSGCESALSTEMAIDGDGPHLRVTDDQRHACRVFAGTAFYWVHEDWSASHLPEPLGPLPYPAESAEMIICRIFERRDQ